MSKDTYRTANVCLMLSFMCVTQSSSYPTSFSQPTLSLLSLSSPVLQGCPGWEVKQTICRWGNWEVMQCFQAITSGGGHRSALFNTRTTCFCRSPVMQWYRGGENCSTWVVYMKIPLLKYELWPIQEINHQIISLLIGTGRVVLVKLILGTLRRESEFTSHKVYLACQKLE